MRVAGSRWREPATVSGPSPTSVRTGRFGTLRCLAVLGVSSGALRHSQRQLIFGHTHPGGSPELSAGIRMACSRVFQGSSEIVETIERPVAANVQGP